MLLKITGIDGSGFNGRVSMPEAQDIGTTVVVLKCETFFIDPTGDEDQVLTDDGRRLSGVLAREVVQQTIEDGDCDNLYTVWTVASQDGRVFQAMDWETELVRGEEN